MAKNEKREVLDVWYWRFTGSSPITLLSQEPICTIVILMGFPHPRLPKTYIDRFWPLGAPAQCKMNGTRWAFGTGASWDQLELLSPQVATCLQYMRTGFPLLECCHKTYIDWCLWRPGADSSHSTVLVTKCYQIW